MRVAVCDDCVQDAQITGELIERYGKEHRLEMAVDLYHGEQDFWQGIQTQKYDAFMLDIFLGDSSGVDIARRLRETDSEAALVFITSSTDFMREGYALNALHYLTKPITYEGVLQAMERCRRLLGDKGRYVELMIYRTSMKIFLADILFAEVFDTTTHIHLRQATHKCYLPLGELEELLGGLPFYRCHRSFLVNLDHVKNLEDNGFLMDNGESVPIRKRLRAEVTQAYHRYLFQTLRSREALTR